MVCANSKGSDQPAQICRLVLALAVCIHLCHTHPFCASRLKINVNNLDIFMQRTNIGLGFSNNET